jgi:hypothetical protein
MEPQIKEIKRNILPEDHKSWTGFYMFLLKNYMHLLTHQEIKFEQFINDNGKIDHYPCIIDINFLKDKVLGEIFSEPLWKKNYIIKINTWTSEVSIKDINPIEHVPYNQNEPL